MSSGDPGKPHPPLAREGAGRQGEVLGESQGGEGLPLSSRRYPRALPGCGEVRVTLTCRRCGPVLATDVAWRIFGNGTRHLAESCAACGTWIRWAPQNDTSGAPTPEMLRAKEQPPARGPAAENLLSWMRR